MSAIAYMDFVAAQCLVSISNFSAMPEVARLKVPGEEQVGKVLCNPCDAWKDYCTLVTIAKSLLELNKYQPLAGPSVCSGNVEILDEYVGSDSDETTEPGSSLAHNSAPGQLPHLHDTVPPKGKLAVEKRHKCPYSGCGKVYGKSSHLKAHYRVHTETLHKTTMWKIWNVSGQDQKKLNNCPPQSEKNGKLPASAHKKQLRCRVQSFREIKNSSFEGEHVRRNREKRSTGVREQRSKGSTVALYSYGI